MRTYKRCSGLLQQPGNEQVPWICRALQEGIIDGHLLFARSLCTSSKPLRTARGTYVAPEAIFCYYSPTDCARESM